MSACRRVAGAHLLLLPP